MNCTSILNSGFRRVLNCLLTNPSTHLVQQTRNTFVLKRRFDTPYQRKGKKSPPVFKRKHYIYDLVEYAGFRRSKAPIDIILTTFVEEIGDTGDRISIPGDEAYKDFLLPGLAVYATPENIKKYEDITKTMTKVQYSSPYVPRTIKQLQHHLLHVIMSNDNKWTLEKWHVRVALRCDTIYVNDDAITLPEREISGPSPDMENKEFYVSITINKREKTNVRCRIHLYSNNPLKSLVNYENFNNLSEPLYPEFKAVLDELPTPTVVTAQIQSRPRVQQME